MAIQTREEILSDSEEFMKSACNVPPADNTEWVVGYLGNWFDGRMGLGKIRSVDESDDELVVVFMGPEGQSPFMIVQHLAPNLWCNLIGDTIKGFEWDDDQAVVISPFSRIAEMAIVHPQHS